MSNAFTFATARLAIPLALVAAGGCSPSSPKAAAMSGTTVASGNYGASGVGGAGVTGASGSAGATAGAASGASGTSGTSGASASSADADAGSASGDDGGWGDATLDASADGSVSVPIEAGPPRCDPTQVWGAPSGLMLTPTASFARFSGVAANELTIAWTQADGTVYVADRASPTDPFGTGQPLTLGATALAVDRVALAADGQTLFAITADRTTFVGFSRSGVGYAWGPLSSAEFVNLAAMVGEGGGALSEPVIGADDATLFFLVTPTNGAPLLAASTYDWVNRVWGGGAGFSNPELASADPTHRRRPTGASSDGLTLFFYDEVAGIERGAWRSTLGGAFEQFVDLPGLDEAAPNSSCATLYVVPSADASTSAIAFVQ